MRCFNVFSVATVLVAFLLITAGCNGRSKMQSAVADNDIEFDTMYIDEVGIVDIIDTCAADTMFIELDNAEINR